MRKHADFRGTITYASLNAHQKIVNNTCDLTNIRTWQEEMTFGAFTLSF